MKWYQAKYLQRDLMDHFSKNQKLSQDNTISDNKKLYSSFIRNDLEGLLRRFE